MFVTRFLRVLCNIVIRTWLWNFGIVTKRYYYHVTNALQNTQSRSCAHPVRSPNGYWIVTFPHFLVHARADSTGWRSVIKPIRRSTQIVVFSQISPTGPLVIFVMVVVESVPSAFLLQNHPMSRLINHCSRFHLSERGDPSASYRWAGWVWEYDWFKVMTLGKSLIIPEESIVYNTLNKIKEKPKDINM